MSIKTVAIHSLGELIDCVTPDKPDPVTGRRRDAGVYRGASDANAPLLTSLKAGRLAVRPAAGREQDFPGTRGIHEVGVV